MSLGSFACEPEAIVEVAAHQQRVRAVGKRLGKLA